MNDETKNETPRIALRYQWRFGAPSSAQYWMSDSWSGRPLRSTISTTHSINDAIMSLDPLSAVVTAIKRDHIIPDVLPADSFTPSLLFSIVYPNGSEVLLGNELTIDETQDEPLVSFAPMNMPVEQADSTGDEVGYTLVMLDPDAPSRAEPLYRSFRHWVVRGLFYLRVLHEAQMHLRCSLQD